MENFSLYQEILSCSVVTDCVCGDFAYDNELMLARHSSLELYYFVSPLRRICKLDLQGETLQLSKFKSQQMPKDLALVLTKEAKISMLTFVHEINNFEFVALYSFENEQPEPPVSVLVDPDFRCIVVRPNRKKLFGITAKTAGRVLKEEGFTHCHFTKELFSPIFPIDMLYEPLDLKLTKGLSEPILVMLYSPHPMRTTTSVKFLSVKPKRRETLVLKDLKGLPEDAQRIIPLEPPLTGVLLISSRSLIFINENSEREFAVDFNFLFATWVFIDPFRLLFQMPSGESLLIGLNFERDTVEVEESVVFSIEVVPIECPYYMYSVKALYSSPWLFAGSALHDSYMFYVQDLEYPQVTISKHEELPGLTGAISSAFMKRTRQDEQEVMELLVSNGFGRNSYLSRVSLSIYPYLHESLDEESIEGVSEVHEIFTIQAEEYDIYVLISKPSSTSILKIDESLDNVTDTSEFITDCETIAAGRVNSQWIYQSTSTILRILNYDGMLVKDIRLSEICQIANVGRLFAVLYVDGLVEVYKINEVGAIALWKTSESSIYISCVHFRNIKVVAIAQPEGIISFIDMKTGNLLKKVINVIDGPAVLSDTVNIDLSITDCSRKLSISHQSENNFLVEILTHAYEDMVVLLVRLNTGEIFIYQSFKPFVFARATTNLYLGPLESPSFSSKNFYILSHGIFVTYPLNNFWVIPNIPRQAIYIHPNIDHGDIFTISSFNCSGLPNGFIYRENDILRIAYVEDDFQESLKENILMARTPCNETPRQIIINLPSIVCSFFNETDTVYSIKFYNYTEEDGLIEFRTVQDFIPNEIILAMCFVTFTRKLNPPKDYLAIGTGMVGTEDKHSQGRLFLFALKDNTITYQPLYKKPGLKGAISALADITGYLLVGVGSEIKIFTFVDEEGQEWLEPVAFQYGYTMACSLDIHENKILVAETRDQMHVYEYVETSNQKNLILVGQYLRELMPLTACFHSHRQVVCDDFRNVLVFSCLPNSEKIEKIADIHTGLRVFTIARSQGDALFMSSFEGALAVLHITNEYVYKKMHTLTNALLEVLPFSAGLNPRSYRTSLSRERERSRKGILDLGLIMSFCFMSIPLQKMIARNIGTTRQNILYEIAEMPFAHHYL